MRRLLAAVVVSATACAGSPAPDHRAASPSLAGRPVAAPAAPAPTLPLYDGLGGYTRAITTRSPEAQRYFDQGFDFYFGFNHADAIRSFTQAAALDPASAMAEWGVALAYGPHYNEPQVDDAHAKAAIEAMARAKALRSNAAPVEQALIDALATRYVFPQPKDRGALDEAYAAAMREVWKSHPGDADVATLFAEALLDVHPWETWSRDGKPLHDTLEAVKALDAALAIAPLQPLANHLYIHALEASPFPERADVAADRLRGLQPALGHMLHMPSHIDVRRGRWEQAILANEKAIVADRAYLDRAPSFYWLYMAHNHHMLMFAAMMRGQSKKALDASRELVALFTPEALKLPNIMLMFDGISSIPLEVMLRFGRWDEILAEPSRGDDYPFFEAFRHYARGVALAAKGQVRPAEDEQRAFAEAAKKVPNDRKYRHDDAAKLLGVAEKLLAGEILFRAGRQAAGIDAMREAARREDALNYAEPPEWVHPVRHALGAALLKAKRFPDAEQVYREDLAKNLGNGWSLVGLARGLKAQKKTKEAAEVEAQFEKAWSAADIELPSSCFCQVGD